MTIPTIAALAVLTLQIPTTHRYKLPTDPDPVITITTTTDGSTTLSATCPKNYVPFDSSGQLKTATTLLAATTLIRQVDCISGPASAGATMTVVIPAAAK